MLLINDVTLLGTLSLLFYDLILILHFMVCSYVHFHYAAHFRKPNPEEQASLCGFRCAARWAPCLSLVSLFSTATFNGK